MEDENLLDLKVIQENILVRPSNLRSKMAGENLKMVLKGKSKIVPPERENILAARDILKEILGEESQESKKRKKDTRKISGEEKKK